MNTPSPVAQLRNTAARHRPDSLITMNSLDSTDLDLVDVVNFVLPGEKHLPGMRYCGPGTRLDLRLNADDTPKPGNEPIDRVDLAAMEHDIAYRRHSDFRGRHTADKEMMQKLLHINQPTKRETCERCIVIPIIYLKQLIGGLIIKCIDYFSRH